MEYSIDFLPETITEYSGYKMFELYRNAEKSILAQEKARAKILDRFGFDIGKPVTYMPTFISVEIFGGKILYPEDAEPGVKKPAIEDITKIRNFSLPASYWEQPCIQYYVKTREYFKKRLSYFPTLQCNPNGPATSAKMFRGDEFFLDLSLHPKEVKVLMDFVTDNLIRYREEISLRQGIEIKGKHMGIWDDVAGMMSPEMYKEFVIPCYAKIVKHFECPSLYLHSEELHPDHLQYIKPLPVTCIDWGWDNYLSIEIVKEKTDFNFSWNFNYIRDIKEGNPNSIRELYKKMVEIGGDRLVRMKGCISRGTPPDNIIALIEVAKNNS